MFFNFNPYTFNRSRVRTIDNFGIPSLRTIYVTTDTTNNTVTYGICPRIWRQLPCEGMFLLNIVNTPATTVTAASLVSIDTTVTDGAVGLTIATDKQQIITMVKNNYNEYKAKKEALAKYEEEMNKCDAILKQLDYQEENLKQEDPRIKELQEQVAELKGLIKQAGNMVPPQMKQMLPQNMQKAMNEAS